MKQDVGQERAGGERALSVRAGREHEVLRDVRLAREGVSIATQDDAQRLRAARCRACGFGGCCRSSSRAKCARSFGACRPSWSWSAPSGVKRKYRCHPEEPQRRRAQNDRPFRVHTTTQRFSRIECLYEQGGCSSPGLMASIDSRARPCASVTDCRIRSQPGPSRRVERELERRARGVRRPVSPRRRSAAACRRPTRSAPRASKSAASKGEGGGARRSKRRGARRHHPRHAIRNSHASQDAGLHDRRGARAGTRHRRHHGDAERRQRRAAAPAAVRGRRSARRHPAQGRNPVAPENCSTGASKPGASPTSRRPSTGRRISPAPTSPSTSTDCACRRACCRCSACRRLLGRVFTPARTRRAASTSW